MSAAPAPDQLLALLAERRVFLADEGGTLRYRAPEGALDELLRQALRQEKSGLMQALAARPGRVLLGPLSYNQRSLYFMYLLEPHSAAYNLALAFRLHGSEDPATLRLALQRLVGRHEQLRTTYGHVEIGGRTLPAQFVREQLPASFELVDAAGCSEADLKAHLRDFYLVPFDLETGPIVRAAVFERGPRESVFIVVVPHVAADARSMNRILGDLTTACREELASADKGGREYTDFACAQRCELESPGGRAHLDYWAGVHTPPATALDLGVEDRRPEVRRPTGSTYHFRLEPALREAAEATARGLGVTPFALLLSVFQWQLMARSGRRDLVVGVPTLGRRGQDFEETVGYFVNPLALRCRREGAPTFRDHAKSTAREFREALDHRDTPFAALVERLGGSRDPARTPVFQVLFNVLSRATLGGVVDVFYPSDAPPPVSFPGNVATAYALEQQEGQFDLTLELVDRGADILGLLKYCTDLFTGEEAARLAAEYRALLESAIGDPGLTLLDALTGGDQTAPPREEPVVAVAATFTAEVLGEFFGFWFAQLGWRASVRYAPFNQVFQELLNPAGLLRANRRGHSVLLVRLQDLLGGAVGTAEDGGPDAAAGRIPGVLEELRQAITTAAQAMRVPLCVVLCPSSPEWEESLCAASAAIEEFLASVRSLPGVVTLTHEEVTRRYPVADYYEPLGETIGSIPYTRPYLAALATDVVRSLAALSRPPIKALVVDCDGTLWDGVAAEDGPTGVSVGSEVKRFQKFLLAQHRAGVILGICSKNREEDVWAVFGRHPEMLLLREHIAFWKINWEPKSVNLPALAAEMNIGLDAVGFLDDNPVERSEVRSRCPAVYCPEMPAAWLERVPWLEHLWLLDHARVTADDRKRLEYYRTEREREDLKRSAGSLADFLEQLDLRVDIRPVEASSFDRLAQLSVRTNQFNTTGLRLAPQEVSAWISTPGKAAHVASVKDRFGDYGLVGGMITRVEGGSLRVEGLFLSCRALGRGVEHRMAAHLARFALEAGCATVGFPCRTTERNEPARKFLSQLAETCQRSLDADGTLHAPAAVLVGARYRPLEAEAGPAAVPGAVKAPSGGGGFERGAAERIASTLQTAEAIVAAVDREKRGRRGRTGVAGPSRPAATAIERMIAQAWECALGLDAVDTQAHFFELGGTSLLMAGVAIQLQRDHGLLVTIVDLFHYPSVAALARHLDPGPQEMQDAAPALAAARRQREALSGARFPAAVARMKQVRGR